MVAFLFQHDRPAVVKDRAVQVAGRVVVHQIVVSGVAAGDHGAVNQDHVANFQRADFFFAQRRFQAHFSARHLESGTRRD